MFWVAIDTLFLKMVKGLSAAEIVSVTTVAMVACIVLQYPILFIIRRIGNTAATRVGSGFLFLSPLLFTFGQGFPLMAAAETAREIGFSFQLMSVPLLKNDLAALGQPEKFTSVRTAGATIYSVVTMLISFVASPMFNVNYYLPMACCIAIAAGCFVLSFFLLETEPSAIPATEKTSKKKAVFSGLLILILISYAAYYPVSNAAQSESKLFTQETVSAFYDDEKVAILIGYMLAASRIARVLANIVFGGVYKKMKENVGYFLLFLLPLSLACFLVGYYLISDPTAQFLVMAAGYLLLLFLRDPFKLYSQDMVLQLTRKEDQQSVLTLMEFLRKLVRAGLNVAFSLLLLSAPLVSVMWLLFGIALPELFFGAFVTAKFTAGQKKQSAGA